MKHRFKFNLFAIGLALHSATALAVIGRHDVPDEVYVENARQFPAVGLVKVYDSSDALVRGASGTLITGSNADKKVIITTAHVPPFDGGKMTFTIEGREYGVRKFVRLEEDTGEDAWLRKMLWGRGRDIALAFPTAVIPIEPVRLYDDSSVELAHLSDELEGSSAWLVGCGHKRKEPVSKVKLDKVEPWFSPVIDPGFNKRAAQVTLEIDKASLSAVALKSEFNLLDENSGLMAPGDSGGALLIEQKGQLRLVGVASQIESNVGEKLAQDYPTVYGWVWRPLANLIQMLTGGNFIDQSYMYGSLSYYSYVPQWTDWIDRTIEQDSV